VADLAALRGGEGLILRVGLVGVEDVLDLEAGEAVDVHPPGGLRAGPGQKVELDVEEVE